MLSDTVLTVSTRGDVNKEIKVGKIVLGKLILDIYVTLEFMLKDLQELDTHKGGEGYLYSLSRIT